MSTLSFPELQALGPTTRRSISLFNTLNKNKNTYGPEGVAVQDLARVYADSIKKSIAAAKQGHTIVVDVMELAKQREKRTLDLESVSDYAAGMRQLATQSREDGRQALNNFRAVREKVVQLRADIQERPEFKDVEETLGAFEKEVSILVKWWDWIVVETPNELDTNFDSKLDILTNKNNIKRWEELRQTFVRYNEVMRGLEAENPHFFKPSAVQCTPRETPVAAEAGWLSKFLSWLKL